MAKEKPYQVVLVPIPSPSTVNATISPYGNYVIEIIDDVARKRVDIVLSSKGRMVELGKMIEAATRTSELESYDVVEQFVGQLHMAHRSALLGRDDDMQQALSNAAAILERIPSLDWIHSVLMRFVSYAYHHRRHHAKGDQGPE